MKNSLTISHAEKTIVMDKTFARNAANTYSAEYAHLLQVCHDYPTYRVVQRHIRTNNNKNSYKGLTYEYMERYILTHGTNETRLENYKEYSEMRIIAECQSKAFRYPVIKSWFLAQYPEIANFGMPETTSAPATIFDEDAKTPFVVSHPKETDEPESQAAGF